MQERYSEEVKSILEAAQQQAVMNYQQELSCAHILVALSSSEGFFRFLLANVKADERNFAQEAKALMQRIPSVKGQDRQLVMSTALARVLGLAAQAAGQGEVNVGNLVAALAGDGDSETVSLLKKYGIDKKKVEGLYMAYTNGQADEESKQTLAKTNYSGRSKKMTGYTLKPGKIGKKLIAGYQKIEEKFVDAFLQEDAGSPGGYTLKTGKNAKKVTGAYQKIEDGVTGTYKKIENGVVGTYQKIEDAFVDRFLEEKR